MIDRALPSGWKWLQIDEICEEKTGTRNPNLQLNDHFIYVDISSIDSSLKRIVEPKKLLGRDAPSRARQIIKAGDILVSTTRPNLNSVAIVPTELDDQICSTGFCVLRPLRGIDAKFLFAYVQSEEFVQPLSNLVKGAMYPAVTDKQVREQWIPVPPESIQQRIANAIELQMAEIETARLAVQAQLNDAEQLAATYLREVFESSRIQEWSWLPLGQSCRLLPSKSIASNGDVEVRAITTACLTEHGFQSQGIKTARMQSKDAAECVVSYGEILVARSNTANLVGRVSMFEGEPEGVVASDLTIRIKTQDGLLPDFLTAYLTYLYITGYWSDRAGGASGSMKKITRSQISNELVPIPLPSIQKEIAHGYKERNQLISQVTTSFQQELEYLGQLLGVILRQAFNGEL